MSLKAKIEAVLFMTDKPLRAQAIAGIVGEEVQVVRQTILDLIHEYEERQGGLEIADEDGYSFQVRDQFANLMDQFMPIEMTAALLRTLSAIAIKQPIAQSEIIRIRGQGAYEHIKELAARGLIAKREDEKNRSPLLTTTKQFQEYFRLTKDGKSLRQYLKKEMKKKDKVETADGVVAENVELDGKVSVSDLVASATVPTVELEVEGSLANLAADAASETLSFEPDSQSVDMKGSAETEGTIDSQTVEHDAAADSHPAVGQAVDAAPELENVVSAQTVESAEVFS